MSSKYDFIVLSVDEGTEPDRFRAQLDEAGASGYAVAGVASVAFGALVILQRETRTIGDMGPG